MMIEKEKAYRATFYGVEDGSAASKDCAGAHLSLSFSPFETRAVRVQTLPAGVVISNCILLFGSVFH